MGFLIYEEMREHFLIYEEVIYDVAPDHFQIFHFFKIFNNAQVPGAPPLTIRNKAPMCDFFVL